MSKGVGQINPSSMMPMQRPGGQPMPGPGGIK